ncbi:MAG TPA: alpha/beta hydrolase [Candidatus Poseidoniales archaeon]|jgi:hypothetical protein|nr:MAG: hydrolase [Euryarchaeota archaeon]HIG02913.1 alpha/beta hydrolase [Candidatus Poseidoniales archaeon]HIK77808.1 alpha/beta hydrolase [Candidatus Poseidoniales archaeon]
MSNDLRSTLWQLLGDLPLTEGRPKGKLNSVSQEKGFQVERWTLFLNNVQDVPAILLIPDNVSSENPAPTILYNHAHGGKYELGKEALLQGRPALLDPPWGPVLCEMGFVVLCIDTWAFGERNGERESAIFKRMLWEGKVLWGHMVYDNLRALDWLVELDIVDEKRIGTMGISMGSTMAWWHAALDDRIKLCIDICCLTDFHTLVEKGNMDGHAIYYYVPNLLLHTNSSEINELIAPRMHLACAGLQDILTPPKGLEIIDNNMKNAYSSLDAADAWELYTEDVGHIETIGMREKCIEWLKKL